MSRKDSRRSGPKRGYPRTARINSLLKRIIADYFEEVEDEGIDFITITGVDVDNDLNKAVVFFSSLDDDQPEVLIDKVSEHSKAIKQTVASQSRLRKTPDILFKFDPAIAEGAKIEKILSDLKAEGNVQET